MAANRDGDWRKVLTSILEDLDQTQYRKLMEYLEKIPKSKKLGKFREKMAGIIIEYYGLEESISVIKDAMDYLPRNDPTVQNLLRPFVDSLREQHDKENQGTKRTHADADESEEPAADPQTSCQPAEQKKARPWQITISDVKSEAPLHEHQAFMGKVVLKSGLRTYNTKDEQKKFFFYLGLADKTACVQVMVYGKERYKQIEEARSYLFRSLIKDQKFVKVKQTSKVSMTSPVEVPEELEVEASRLLYPESPFYSIAEVKTQTQTQTQTQTHVSVEGTIQEIDPVEDVGVSYQKQKTKRQRFKLKDESGSIWIKMWGEQTKPCQGLSVGDVVKLTNMKTNVYHEEVELNSTAHTKIQKDRTVGILKVKVEIVGILKAIKKETRLEAEFNHEVHTFVVASKLLAQELGIKQERDFRDRLLDKIPLIADVEIEGNRIKKMKAVQMKAETTA